MLFSTLAFLSSAVFGAPMPQNCDSIFEQRNELLHAKMSLCIAKKYDLPQRPENPMKECKKK